MPLNILGTVVMEGTSAIPYYDHLKVYVPIVAGVGAIKWVFTGASNTWERKLHGKVIIMTVSEKNKS